MRARRREMRGRPGRGVISWHLRPSWPQAALGHCNASPQSRRECGMSALLAAFSRLCAMTKRVDAAVDKMGGVRKVGVFVRYRPFAPKFSGSTAEFRSCRWATARAAGAIARPGLRPGRVCSQRACSSGGRVSMVCACLWGRSWNYFWAGPSAGHVS